MATGRTSRIVGNNSADDNNLLGLRIQRLRLLGVIGQRAKLLSELAWETGQ